MAARLFISYRTADGADKATALARDLGRVFGDDQVFLDKDDLQGGAPWAQAVADALGARPALLLLVTPQLFGATDAAGRRRIDDPEDPVRREIASALAAGAALIPVLCDGVDALPPDDALPPALAGLAERTWRRLRAYDWAADVKRLVTDLQAHGVRPAGHGRRRVLAAAAASATLVALAGGVAWWARRGQGEDVGAGPLDGRWAGQLGPDPVRLLLRQDGERLTLVSEPIDIRERADWADYRRFWRERTGSELDAVRVRGDGTLRTGPGTPPVVELALTVLTLPDESAIDGGNLTATLAPDGRLRGTRWLNGAQRSMPAELVRLR